PPSISGCRSRRSASTATTSCRRARCSALRPGPPYRAVPAGARAAQVYPANHSRLSRAWRTDRSCEHYSRSQTAGQSSFWISMACIIVSDKFFDCPDELAAQLISEAELIALLFLRLHDGTQGKNQRSKGCKIERKSTFQKDL